MDAATIAPSLRAKSQTSDEATSELENARAPGGQPGGRQLDSGRVRDIVLVRIATAGKVLTRAELSADLWPIVAQLVSATEWQVLLDRDLGALADAGLCDVKPIAVAITAAGGKRAALMLGVTALPRTWAEARAIRLMAKALGVNALPPRLLKGMGKADGLRAIVVQQAFKLRVRGVPTSAKLRVQLAALALSRAFDNSLPTATDVRSGLSAKAGRGLAGRLAHPPRAFATDARLIAALAMEHAGASKADFASLQTALLRRYVTRGEALLVIAPPTAAARKKKRRLGGAATAAATAPRLQLVAMTPTTSPPSSPSLPIAPAENKSVAPPSAAAAVRPDFQTFVASVRRAALAQAEGWPGNRKAFVSRVWAAVQVGHPEWSVSVLEFKAMLTEAHRHGQIVLANADLKDQHAIGDLQASAIAYKNAIFHYVRVDD